jgi:cytochrome d ubiquinol oxidase subunit I
VALDVGADLVRHAAVARGPIENQRSLLWIIFCSFPLAFIATLSDWYTAEVGRQPWAVYGKLLTADAATPFLTSAQVATTLVLFAVVYSFIFLFGAIYICRLLHIGPVAPPRLALGATNPKRPLSLVGGRTTPAVAMAVEETLP